MLPPVLAGLRLPVVASPMFIVSGPDLVIAQCKAGIVGSFPALNARESDGEPPLLDACISMSPRRYWRAPGSSTAIPPPVCTASWRQRAGRVSGW